VGFDWFEALFGMGERVVFFGKKMRRYGIVFGILD
jgi:hypothetical protein